MRMRVLPVLDIKNGEVVHGVAGRRDEYRPIRSCLTPSARPADVARAFQEHFGWSEIYLADLDAIAGAPPALDLYRTLGTVGCRLWVDAGLRSGTDVEPLLGTDITGIVAGLETLAGPPALAEVRSEEHTSELQ